MFVEPIAATPLAIAIALGVTLPIALRRTRPLLAAFLGTLPWFIPTDGYVIVGYVAIFVLMYSVAAYVDSPLRVGLISAYIIAIGLGGAYLNDETTGEYVGAVTAVLLPVLAGRLVRHHREQTEQLRELTAELAARARADGADGRGRGAHPPRPRASRRRGARHQRDRPPGHGVRVAPSRRRPEQMRAVRSTRSRRGPRSRLSAEMRRLLGMLRESDEGGSALAPQPSLAHLDGARRSHPRGQASPVDGAQSRARHGSWRRASTCLGPGSSRRRSPNALKHAGHARVDVFVRYGEGICSRVRGCRHRRRRGVDGRGLQGMGLPGCASGSPLLRGRARRPGPRSEGGYAVRGQAAPVIRVLLGADDQRAQSARASSMILRDGARHPGRRRGRGTAKRPSPLHVELAARRRPDGRPDA